MYNDYQKMNLDLKKNLIQISNLLDKCVENIDFVARNMEKGYKKNINNTNDLIRLKNNILLDKKKIDSKYVVDLNKK